VTTLDNLRKAAKRWLKALRDGDPEARERFRRAHPQGPAHPTLRDVQYALARERGHDSWRALTRAATGTRESDPLTALLAAAGQGDVATVSTILDAHPGIVNERGELPGNTGARTALHFGSGHAAVVRMLLERGANPNIRDEGDNAYPIHFAAERGDLEIVTLLIEHGADPIGAGTTHELDVLGWAVGFESATHVDVARYLLAHGATHTLVSAVALGDVDAIRALAAAGAGLNQRMDSTNRRRTPLHLAVIKKQPAALAALVELGADLGAVDAVGLTTLDQAAIDGQDEMTERLLAAGSAITLPAAIALERPDDVERLVRENPEALSTTNNRQWARLLVHASGRASARVLQTLLRTVIRHRSGLSLVNMDDDREMAVDGAPGYTPLHAAAFHGNDEAVRVLLKHGANPRARDGKYCSTPAGWAAYAGHLGTANLILDADVDIFDAITLDRADRVGAILDQDPGAIDRPFRAYASCEPRDDQWWPTPECTPVQWATLRQKPNALRVLMERGPARTPEAIERANRIVTFLQTACWDHTVHGKGDHRMYDRAAQRLLAQDPSIAHESLYTAIVCGNLQEVARILAADPEAARRRGGARGWTPILYLAYTRFTHPPTIDHALAIARLLLDHGADPNDFYMAGDAQYSVLTGVAGEGEQDSPRQPYAAALFEFLLERDAGPFDIQVLYDTHFSGDILWWLEIVYRRTFGTAAGEVWKDPDWPMLDMGNYGSGARFLLETAIKRRNMPLAEWVLAHGANANAAPARDKRFPMLSLYELALLEGLPDMADLLARYGAVRSEPAVDDHQRFVDACFRLDADEARRMLAEHPEYRQSPQVMFDAARRDRADVLRLLLDLGFDLEAKDQGGKRVLHEAALNNSLRVAEFLIERDADVDAREPHYGGTPLGWAAHADHAEMMTLISRRSRDIWPLCFRGFVDRVRAILKEDPSRARVTHEEGDTPLWWLPDDEEKAMQILELLLAAGADPSARNARGGTAADWARRRGMLTVAARLERSA